MKYKCVYPFPGRFMKAFWCKKQLWDYAPPWATYVVIVGTAVYYSSSCAYYEIAKHEERMGYVKPGSELYHEVSECAMWRSPLPGHPSVYAGGWCRYRGHLPTFKRKKKQRPKNVQLA